MDREQRRDDLLSTIQQQMADNMSFMQESQRRTDRSYDTVLQSLQVITDTQARQQHHRQHIALIKNTQDTILGNLREVRTAQDTLQARMDQRDRRRTRSRRPPQDGEGTSGQQ